VLATIDLGDRHVSAVLFVPAPVAEGDSRARSEALRKCLEEVLARVLATTSLLTLQVGCPLLIDGPVVAERPPGTSPRGDGTLSFTSHVIPATSHVPEATLWVSANSEIGRSEVHAVPVMLSAYMESEMSRLIAESTARGALEIANRDPATGLGNRRAWLQTLHVEAGRSRRTGRPITIVILDIDGLKQVNDAYGHAAGDSLIARAASALSNARRATDVVCRLGGDEFGVAAGDTDAAAAEVLASRLREGLLDQGVRVSLGWATSAHLGIDDLWQRADAAMYEEKRSRRLS
jgi:diguanylate cyclase (GGDEF)-like protein